MSPDRAPRARRAARSKTTPPGDGRTSSPSLPPSVAEGTEEVLALIEALHETGKRLEELTAGEVDSVADRHGRSILLPRAQDHLRQVEEMRRAAILNALPANIALLDERGLILSVNESWWRFAGANGLRDLDSGIGRNYLDVCDRARGKDSAGAHEVADGIRAVLGGTAEDFSWQYSCESPTQQRWFRLEVAPLVCGRPGGAVVIHADVTAERKVVEELRESELRFSDFLGNVDLASVMVDREGRVTYCNDSLLHLTGWGREEVIGWNWFERFAPPEQGDLEAFLAALLGGRSGTSQHENEILTRSGERRLVHWNNSVLRSGDGAVVGVASIGEDITERKRVENRLKRLTRVYAMLSQINGLIVRVSGRDELFSEACRIAVDTGDFKMAWIGVIDRATLDGEVVAWSGGEKGDTELVRLTAREGTPDSERPASRASRLSQPVICNDLLTDPSAAVLREATRRRGFGSMACFPLTVTGKPEAVIALYAAEPGVFDDEEQRLLVEVAGDISFALDHLEKARQLEYLAYYDELTGLANRTLLLERVAQHLRFAARGGHRVALFLVDLERFKNLNDSVGQSAGDELLRQVAQWLTRAAGDPSLLARVGGDQFAVVVPEAESKGDLVRRLERTTEAFLAHPFRLNDAVLRIAARAGVALFPEDGFSAAALFRSAEAALKRAKGSGERFQFYAQGTTEATAEKLTLENQLRYALDRQEFVLHYQPKTGLTSGKLTSAEALIRWNDPRTGLVPPSRFIPILEETGLIHEVGRWALQKAVEVYRGWRDAGLPAVRIAVNVSPLQLRSRDFVDEIRQVIGSDGQAAGGLELEITESLIMEDVKHSIVTLKAIRDLGVRIAIDDFGTGFSSLSYLSRLPVHTLKIDRSFVVDMTEGPEGLALVSTIINLAHSLKLEVVAEGVETQEQSRLLRLLDCDEMQGFLFSKPVPREIFEARFLTPPEG